jgi:hypothetical protein
MGRILALALLLLSAPAYAIEYQQPPGAPEIYVPNHGVVVTVFAAQTAIGHGIGVFEKRPTGLYLCGQCIVDPAYPTLDGDVSAAGGPGPYVASKVSSINAILASRFPAVGGGPVTTLDQVNQALQGMQLRLVNGSPVLGPRP